MAFEQRTWRETLNREEAFLRDMCNISEAKSE